MVYEDIYDAKTAVDHLSGFNVANRYLIVLYYNTSKHSKKVGALVRGIRSCLYRRCQCLDLQTLMCVLPYRLAQRMRRKSSERCRSNMA